MKYNITFCRCTYIEHWFMYFEHVHKGGIYCTILQYNRQSKIESALMDTVHDHWEATEHDSRLTQYVNTNISNISQTTNPIISTQSPFIIYMSVYSIQPLKSLIYFFFPFYFLHHPPLLLFLHTQQMRQHSKKQNSTSTHVLRKINHIDYVSHCNVSMFSYFSKRVYTCFYSPFFFATSYYFSAIYDIYTNIVEEVFFFFFVKGSQIRRNRWRWMNTNVTKLQCLMYRSYLNTSHKNMTASQNLKYNSFLIFNQKINSRVHRYIFQTLSTQSLPSVCTFSKKKNNNNLKNLFFFIKYPSKILPFSLYLTHSTHTHGSTTAFVRT